MFGKDGIANLMKQAQLMKSNMEKVKKELETIEVEGQSGAGMVKFKMTCDYAARRVVIDQNLLTDNIDKEMLEDLIVAATNDALRQVAAISQEKMSAFNAGLNFPAGMQLPF